VAFTSDRPAVAAMLPNLVVLAWKDTNSGNILYSTSMDGIEWSAGQPIPNASSSHAPSLVFASEKIVAAWKGANDGNIYTAEFDGTSWSQQPSQLPGPNTAASAPSIAFFQNQLYVACRDGSGTIWWTCDVPPPGVAPPPPPPGAAAPATAETGSGNAVTTAAETSTPATIETGSSDTATIPTVPASAPPPNQ
jgi:hypothetical protein